MHSFRGENGSLTPVINKACDKDSFALTPATRRFSSKDHVIKPPISKFGSKTQNKNLTVNSDELNEVFVEAQPTHNYCFLKNDASYRGSKNEGSKQETFEKTSSSTNDSDMSSVGDEDCQIKKIYFEYKKDAPKRLSQLKGLKGEH